MEVSSYNAYLFITKNSEKIFGITRFQTNDTFNIRTETFMNKKETEITDAKFQAKSQTILETGLSEAFNNCRMTIEAKSIMVIWKNQAKKLVLIDIKDSAKNYNMSNSASAELIWRQYANCRLYLIIQLPLNQKN